MSENSDSTDEPANPTLLREAPQKSIAAAYGLWLLAGFAGAHRWYLSRWWTALLYVVLLFIIMDASEDVGGMVALPLLAFWIVDAFLLPWTVRKRNKQLQQEFATNPERFAAASDLIAPWALDESGEKKKSSLGYILATPFRIYFIIAFPIIFGMAAREYHSLELLIVPIVILVAIGLVDSLDKILLRFPVLLEIPGVGQGIERVAQIREHFWNNEPKILSSFWGLFRYGTSKYKPFWQLAIIVMATVIIESAISYKANYQMMPWEGALEIVGITAIVSGLFILFNLTPLTAVAFRYSLSGRRLRLRFLTVAAVYFMVFGYFSEDLINNFPDKDEVSHEEKEEWVIPTEMSLMRLKERLGHAEFRESLSFKIEILLNYYFTLEDEEQMTEENMTKTFRGLIADIAPNDEPKGLFSKSIPLAAPNFTFIFKSNS